ncbi:MAG TPA: DUF885 family protein, partial [Rhizomicrobium sp.]|nr:DUF885 family protein [Rhizomicrobium sp.]
MATRRHFLGTAAALAALLPLPAGAQVPPDADARFRALLDRLGKEVGAKDGLSALRGFDPAPLSFEARLDYDGIAEGLGLEAALGDFGFGAVGATLSPYVVNQRIGAWQGRDAAAVAAETERLKADAASGIVPPDFILAATLAKLAGARAAATGPLAAALEAQSAALNDLRPHAVHDAGAWRLPRGGDYYALALQAGTSLPLAPQAAHQAGLAQLRELSARAEPLLRKQGLTRGSVGARLHALAQRPRDLYSDDDAGRAKAVADMNGALARVAGVLGKAFNGLSPGAVSVVLAGPGKIGYREAPSYDGSKPGAY